MGPLDFLLHAASFAAPAIALAVLLPLLARLVLRPAQAAAWWVQVAGNAAAGLAVLAAGLVITGRDGKMATYGALVLAVATAQWLSLRAWRK